jgi:precorrin-4/cobalt-precorrin-4 C11-methyltransferase
MDQLSRRGIPFESVPGVSSFSAAAAAIHAEYTLPGISQTLILTRMTGRTEVPESESITALAQHHASMVIFLSVQAIDELAKNLQSSYEADTPAAVIYKASWPDQIIVRGTLADIAQKVHEAGITKTALILVGRFMGNEYTLSKLYDPQFTHGFRKASA